MGLKRIVRLWSDESAATTVEYTVLLGLVTGTVLLSLAAISSWAETRWLTFEAAVSDAPVVVKGRNDDHYQ